ncbi:class I SAM-dependent methyltransferase [Pseudonocardia sp. NPDC046786]|uniref:class I SAM-dependent methyltransferase n=1 Tax=Pseudonocardia sp. NPDC046786 TaxID=3155471 RepID=UPI00340E7149
MTETTASPLHERVLAGAAPGARLLDVGCGAGELLVAGLAAGLTVSGVDVERGALAMAERAATAADLRPGDAHELPFDDDAFDLVTLVQVLEHLTNPVLALREAGRVCAPGGAVRASVWGTPDECDAAVIGVALAPLTAVAPAPRQDPPRAGAGPGPGAGGAAAVVRPGTDRSGSGAPPLTDPERLAKIAGTAGLVVRGIAVVRVPTDHPDPDDLVAGVLASGPGRHAARSAGPGAVRDALLAALEPFRVGEGYRLVDTVRVLDATPG